MKRVYLLLALTLCAPAYAGLVGTIVGERDGGGASLLITTTPGVGFGVSGFELGDARWYYGTLTTTNRLGARTIFDAQADIGSGRNEARATFHYRIARAGFTREIVPRRLWAELESRFIDVDRETGNLLKGGVRVGVGNATSISTDAYVSTGGNLHSHYLTARVDIPLQKVAFLAGGAAGTASPVMFDQPGLTARKTRVRQAFAGISSPTGFGRLQFIVETVRTDESHRVRGMLTWIVQR